MATALKWSTTMTGSPTLALLIFLRDVGKYFTVNYMMSKRIRKNGLKQAFVYREFAYQIMQG